LVLVNHLLLLRLIIVVGERERGREGESERERSLLQLVIWKGWRDVIVVRLGVHAEVVHIFRFLELSVADLWSGQRGEGE
jgi:hypothetical protein